MTTMARRITGGVDTHLDVHVAAALDERGALLGIESFSTTAAGYRGSCAGSRASGSSSSSASKGLPPSLMPVCDSACFALYQFRAFGPVSQIVVPVPGPHPPKGLPPFIGEWLRWVITPETPLGLWPLDRCLLTLSSSSTRDCWTA
jgi:hypothetical protein